MARAPSSRAALSAVTWPFIAGFSTRRHSGPVARGDDQGRRKAATVASLCSPKSERPDGRRSSATRASSLSGRPTHRSSPNGPAKSSRSACPSIRPSARRKISPATNPHSAGAYPDAIPGVHSGAMAATLAQTPFQSNHSSGSMASGKPASPAWCDSAWATVIRSFPACPNSGHRLAAVCP